MNKNNCELHTEKVTNEKGSFLNHYIILEGGYKFYIKLVKWTYKKSRVLISKSIKDN